VAGIVILKPSLLGLNLLVLIILHARVGALVNLLLGGDFINFSVRPLLALSDDCRHHTFFHMLFRDRVAPLDRSI
jgi:hypothetical protein